MSNPDVSNLPSGTVAIEEIAPIQKGWGGVGKDGGAGSTDGALIRRRTTPKLPQKRGE